MGGRAVLLFDGECAFCRKCVAVLMKLDWLKRVECRDARVAANIPPCDVPLVPQKLLDEMHLVTPDGRRAYAGYRAIRWLSWRLPPLWALAPFFYLPGALWLGTRFYRWIARNRFKLVPCEHGACRMNLHDRR